ncbi:MAG: VOC family protein [Planctomycetota bacterium]|jgi:catechol 2,3-dioxygenase-like lactoylglutathione lyase family enzyme
MKLEHVAFQVAEPAEVAGWYCEHLGMVVADQVGQECFFLVDSAGEGMLEVYHNSAEPVPDYAAKTPVELHVAFWSADVIGECDRLEAAGATVISRPGDPTADFQNAMLRDPWGLPLQVIKRPAPLY